MTNREDSNPNYETLHSEEPGLQTRLQKYETQ